MTWREQLVARILLIIARMVAGDAALQAELRNLSNHIGANGEKFKDAA